jgi:hypothetical protein
MAKKTKKTPKKNRPTSHKERTSLDERFKALSEQWYKDTFMKVRFDSTLEFESIKEIMKMGEPVLRFIIRDIHKSTFWHAILAHMTGECPIPEEDAGKIVKMEDHWRKWGRDRGYPV